MNFVKEYNERTANMAGQTVPVLITVYEDRSFTFVTKTPPASALIKKAAGVGKGAPTPGNTKAGTVTRAQVRDIAEKKMPDLNAYDVDAAMQMIEGTARAMGITVVEG